MQPAGSGHGLAVFDKKGELSRAEGVAVFAGGVMDISGIGPHLQHGDVDFQVPLTTNVVFSSSCTIVAAPDGGVYVHREYGSTC